MRKQYHIAALIFFALLLGTAFFIARKNQNKGLKPHIAFEAMAAQFDYLSQNGNSSCSATFQKSIPQMSDNNRVRGSCCSPMSFHRYSEQVEGLKKYGNIAEIPPNPYDIEAGLAKKLMGYYERCCIKQI